MYVIPAYTTAARTTDEGEKEPRVTPVVCNEDDVMYIAHAVLLIIKEVVGVVHHIGIQLAHLSKVLKDDDADFLLRGAGANLVDEVLDRVVVAGPEQLEKLLHEFPQVGEILLCSFCGRFAASVGCFIEETISTVSLTFSAAMS